MIKRLVAMSLFAMASLFASAAATVIIGENETKNLATSDYGDTKEGTIIVAASGATLCFPATTGGKDVAFYPHLVVSGGVVHVTFPEGSKYGRLRFVSGIRAVDGGSLVVEGFKQVSVDRETVVTSKMLMPSTGPLCDIGDMTFTASGASGLLLRLKSTVRKLPSTCNVSIEKDATIALACDTDADSAPIRDGNSFAVDKFDVIALTASALPDGCHVRVSPGRSFSFKPAALAADGLSYTPQTAPTGRFNIELLGRGATVCFANDSGKNIRCESNITGLGEILFKPSSETAITRFRGMTYRASSSSSLSIPVDSVNEPAPTESWKAKVAHWFDASDADTIVPFTFDPNTAFGWSGAKNEFNDHQIVIGWKDKVAGSTISLYNTRIWNNYDGVNNDKMKGDYYLSVMPCIVEGGLNGKNYMYFGKQGVNTSGAMYNSSGALASANENRRLQVWNSAAISGDVKAAGKYTTFQSPYCIMVYGSQEGGGKAMLGTVKGYGNLARNASQTNQAWTAYNGFSLHVDGVQVDPKNEKPTGGWQILALDMTATNTLISGIGIHQDSGYGGQNYAEIIFFSEKPTVVERSACERYLAEKWGLESSYTQWDVPYAQLSGNSGTVTLYDDARTTYDSVEEIVAEGSYSGTVNIPSGKTLVIEKPLPPTEADVPEENRVGWYDPDFPGAALSTNELSHTDLLWTLYGRTLTDLCNAGNDRMYASGGSSGSTMEQAKKKNFAPRMVTGVRGALTTGPSRKWLVFKEEYSDSLGNTIRTKKVSDGALASMSELASPVKQAFFVTDTSSGGGSVVSPNVNFNSGIIHRAANAPYTDPVWASGNTVQIAKTWLDTTEINGMEKGYNGRPEVLSFSTVDGFKPSYIAWYQGGNAEILGEFIYYSEPLEDAARTKVQEYLMYKWFGDLNGKYADYSGATVTGAGTVKSPTLRNLPKFGDNFSGSLVGGSRLEFNIGAEGVADPLDIERALSLEDGAVVTVNFTGNGKPKPGSYQLLAAESIAGTATLNPVGLHGSRSAKLSVANGEISVEITGPGLTVFLR